MYLFFSPWIKRTFMRSHDRKRQSVFLLVCEWRKLNCLRLKLFELTWWTTWNLYFRWIIKGAKDPCQKGNFLTCVRTRFLIYLRALKLLTKKESQNKESVASWLLIKNKLMWYFLPYQSQFSNIAGNKH